MNLMFESKSIKNLKEKSLDLLGVYGLELRLLRRELKLKALRPLYNQKKSQLLNEASKRDLYERAKNLNIYGRSKMDKQELLNALQVHNQRI